MFEDGQQLLLPTEVVRQCQIEAGDHASPEVLRDRLTELSRDILPEKLRSYLARYPKSKRQCVDHFTRKGYPEKVIRSFLPKLREEGYLDDREVALQHIRRRVGSKPRGKSKLTAELVEKGIDAELARQVVNEEVPPEREEEMARRYCRDHGDLPRRKLAGRLSRRGFPSGLIRRLLSEFADES